MSTYLQTHAVKGPQQVVNANLSQIAANESGCCEHNH